MFSSLILKIAAGICCSDYSYLTDRHLIYKLSGNFSTEAAQRNLKLNLHLELTKRPPPQKKTHFEIIQN